MQHETAGPVAMQRVANHYALECWTQRNRKAQDPEALVAPPESALHVARAADEVMRDVEEAGPVAIPETGIHEDEVRLPGLRGPEAPSAEEIERHWLTHTPSHPWCEVCVRTKANDMAHKRQDRKDALIPPIQKLDRRARLATWSSLWAATSRRAASGRRRCCRKGRQDPYSVALAVSWLAVMGPWRVELQAPAERAFIGAKKGQGSQGWSM